MNNSKSIGRILAVDDDLLILYVLEMTLCGFSEIKTVGTAEKALEEAGSCFYDLCFLDPGINGLEAMMKIKKISPKTKVVIMTASSLNEQMKQAVEDYAYHFIEKPFKLAQIREMAIEALQNVQRGHHDNNKGYALRRVP